MCSLQYLEEASAAVDKAVELNITAVERMKKLLTAKDKKAMILEMAEANEIDVALLDLLQQNIEAAKEAGQQEAVNFMEKVKQAAAKFLVTGLGSPA
jgi:MFS superfamily sulfate permease-like transporter